VVQKRWEAWVKPRPGGATSRYMRDVMASEHGMCDTRCLKRYGSGLSGAVTSVCFVTSFSVHHRLTLTHHCLSLSLLPTWGTRDENNILHADLYKIPGMTVPWIYYGGHGSAFGLHLEDCALFGELTRAASLTCVLHLLVGFARGNKILNACARPPLATQAST